MAASRGRSCASVAAAAVALVWVNLSCIWGATYIVGDAQGWNLGVNYNAWAAKNTFRAGDVLIFTYNLIHSVVEVSQSDFASCTINPINTYSSGNDSVVLSSTKTAQYFICGTGGHCNGGMALQISISPAAAAPAPATPAAPAPVPTPAKGKAPVKAPAKAPAPSSELPPAPSSQKAPASQPEAPTSPVPYVPVTPTAGEVPPAAPTTPASAPAKSSGFSIAASALVSFLAMAAIAVAL